MYLSGCFFYIHTENAPQKHSRLACLERFAILLVSSTHSCAFTFPRKRHTHSPPTFKCSDFRLPTSDLRPNPYSLFPNSYKKRCPPRKTPFVILPYNVYCKSVCCVAYVAHYVVVDCLSECCEHFLIGHYECCFKCES